MLFDISNAIGNTPVVIVKGLPDYYAKLEGFNPFGSIKDRAASYVLNKGYEQGLISASTEIIESSSGNFAISLAAVCRIYGNAFTCVVDPNLTPLNRLIIQSYGANIVVADKADENGSYLKSRLDVVCELTNKNENLYWVNQYDSAIMRQAYYDTIGYELCKGFETIDYLFVPVSTCGTISGLSKKIREEHPTTKIIAVDINGSKIFCESAHDKRYIPGMGASIVPGNLPYAHIDEVVHVHETDALIHCRALLKQSILVGGSSGATSAAIEKYFGKEKQEKIIVAIFPDRGERYFSSIHDDEWCISHSLLPPKESCADEVQNAQPLNTFLI